MNWVWKADEKENNLSTIDRSGMNVPYSSTEAHIYI